MSTIAHRGCADDPRLPPGENIACRFVIACQQMGNPTIMEGLASCQFSCDATWSYGKRIFWNNIQQMIGAQQAITWCYKRTSFKIIHFTETEVTSETVVLKENTKIKVTSIWKFTFSRGLIQHLSVDSTVSKVNTRKRAATI